MTVNALVTAKSFSDRVPYKNLRYLDGKTKSKQLYKWTTDFLEDNLGIFGRTYFSSDKPDAFNYDRELIRTIERPKALCDDGVPHMASVKHAIIHMRNQLDVPDYIMLFQPTNPFHSRRVIENAIQLAKEENLDAVYSYYTDTNLRTNYVKHAACIKGKFAKVKSGNFYLYRTAALVNNKPAASRYKRASIEVPKFAGYNINNQEDFGIVTALAKCHVLGGSDYEL